MAEINGGSLKYTAELDISGLKAALNEGGKGLVGLSEAASDSGKEIDKAISEANKIIATQAKFIAELQKKYEELQATISNTPKETVVSPEQQQELEAYKMEIIRLKDEIELYQKKIFDVQSVIQSFTDDNVALKKELEDLKKELLNVAKAHVEIEKGAETFDITTENIKIQKEVILDLENQYKELQKTIEKLAPGQAKVNLMTDAAGIAKEIELEKKALIELQNYVSENSGEHERLRKKLLSVKNEMAQLVNQGKQNTKQYEELSQKADDYQDSIDSVNKTMKFMDGSKAISALAEGLGLASGAMSTFQGFAAMAAGDNERLDQIMVKLQSTMSIAIGVQQLQNSLQKESSVIQSVMALQSVARARAEALATSNTIAATVAQRIFNTVAKANPYILLATALITVVGALILFSKKTKDAKENETALAKATADGAAESISSYKKLQYQWNLLGNDLKKKEQFIKDNKDEFRKLGTEVENVSDAENVLIKNTNTFVNSLMLRARAAAEMEIAQENYKKYLENKDKVDSNEKGYKSQTFGGINKTVDDFGRDYLGIGGVSKGANNDFLKTADQNIKNSVKTTQKAADELEKAKIKIAASPPSKGSEAWYKNEIARLEELKSKAVVGSKEWNAYKKQIENYQELINPKKAKKTKKEKVDEFFPPGSVGEIQKRIGEIDKALSKATGDKQISDLKTKRISAAAELAEAEKKIQILSIQEQLDQSNKLWAEYYSTVESLGKNVADNIYGDLLKEGQSQFDQLVNLQQRLSEKSIKGTLTSEEKEVYNQATLAIDSMLGKQSALDKFNSDIEFSLSKLTTATERFKFIQEQQGNLTEDDKGNGKVASLEEFNRREVDRQKEQYQNLLIEHQSYEDQRIEIDKQATAKRIEILNDPKLTPEKKAKLTESITKQQTQETSNSALDELENSGAWEMLYQNIDSLTAYQIDKLLMALEEKKDLLSAKMTPVDLRSVITKLRSAKQQLIAQNPFQGMVTSFKLAIKGFGAETEEETIVAQENFEDAAAAVKSTYQKVGDAAGALEPFKDVLGEFGAEALDAILGFATSAVTVAIMTKTTLSAIRAAIKSGEWTSVILAILQIIMIVIKAVVSLISWLWKMGDKKKEKQIKEWAAAVKVLKQEYDALKDSIDRAMGEDIYKNQTQMIANLKEQQRIIADMRQKEQDKKKTDNTKVDEYDGQISDINNQINDIYDNISQSIAQTNAKDLASSLADALIEAYSKGENAAEAYGKVADDVMKNAVKNALKMQLLEGPMQNVIKQLIKNMGFNSDGTGTFDGLTQAERDQIKAMIATASNNYTQALGAYSDLFGEAAGNANSLEGAIKGITEETASVLAGQMNAIRIMQGEVLKIHQDSNSVLKNSLTQLIQIEINTRYLRMIYDAMKDKGILRGSGII